MEPAPENFEKLQKLMSLKRHEVPPPGYFDSFSSKVCARIRAESEQKPMPWWQRLFAFEMKPVMVAGYACAVVALVGLGIRAGMQADSQSATAPGIQQIDTAGTTQGQPALAGANLNRPLELASTNIQGSNSTPPNFLLGPSDLNVEKAGFSQPK